MLTTTTVHISDCLQDCEAAMNEQINIEYTNSYVYHALFNYFDRDNVGLPGFAKFFKEASSEEREHAEKLMEFQTKRGGRVVLKVCLDVLCLLVFLIWFHTDS
jgi:ferritin heavy chain